MPAPENYGDLCVARAREEEAAGKAALAIGDTATWQACCAARDAWLRQTNNRAIDLAVSDDEAGAT